MPEPRDVEVLHDDGTWYPGELLRAYRDDRGRWRAVVRYAVTPGMRYQRGLPQHAVRRPQAATGEAPHP